MQHVSLFEALSAGEMQKVAMPAAPDDTHQPSRSKEARSHGRMAGGAAQQARVF